MIVHLPRPLKSRRANALLLVLVMLGVSIVMAAGLYSYNANSSRLNQRNNDYYSAVGASEAATEKVLSQITSDFHDYGDGYVKQRLDVYRQSVPTTAEALDWTNFDFLDSSGTLGRMDVTYTPSAGFTPL